jgi:glycosyltransferase involved in cell wall biosynthesis/polysaccharide pyruvyl transferase WcaK-like protein
MKKKSNVRPKIAHFGAFDHDSYGDLIFPLLVEYFLPEFDFTHVSPTGNPTPWPDAKQSISVAEAITRDDWDGVLVGGGDIIQSGEWATGTWAQTPLLSIGALPSLWCGASLLAAKLNIPCAWNAPGVPQDLPTHILSIATEAVQSVEYLCLRDSFSAERLNRLLTRPALVAPDTALGICELWPAPSAGKKTTTKPLILSLSPADVQQRWHEIEVLLDLIRTRSDFSGEVIILPCMGWQSDTGLLSLQPLSKSSLTIVVKDRSLSLQECALEIAGGLAYVGNSLHGLITAISYGVPAVLVNPLGAEASTKYKGFADHFSSDRVDLLAKNFIEAAFALKFGSNINTNSATNRLHDHWLHVRRCFQQKQKNNKSEIWQKISESARQENETMLMHGVSAQKILCSGIDFKLQITEREALIGNLGQTVESLVLDRDSQKAGIGLLQGSLEKLAQERDEQVTQLYGVVAEREALIGNLGQTVESLVLDRDSQKAGIGLLQGSLEKLAQERDEQVTQLYGVVAEREALIGNLGQTVESLVLDRDAQKARLEQAQSAFTQLAHVRDEQITRFTQVVAEREQSILSLRTENETLGKELSNVYGSRSWRLTSPMRKLAYFMKRIYGIFFGRLNRYGKLPLPSYEKPEPAQNLFDGPLSVNAQLSASDASNRYRILLVSYYCPTRAHAGGLRILDIYALIRQQRPDVRIDLLTHHRPAIDGSIDNIYQIFDNVYLSQAEDLTPRTLVSLRGGTMLHYDLVDLQFHQSAYQLDAFRQVATKVIFTPMESQAKALFLDIATKFKSGKGVGFTRIASLIKLVAEEISFCRKADEVVCVSRTDATFLRAVSGTRRVRGIDTGISKFEFAEALELGFLPHSAKLKKLKIIYIAYFGSETNVIALKWFLENVHPAIKEKVPGYVLTVVGRGDLSGFEKFRGTSVELVGEVPAIAPYISEARVGIAPALGGSGLRGKVNQYAVLGVPCVVSPIALKGLAYRDAVNVCVAETPTDFAERCIRLLTDLELNDQIATAARQLCMDRYSWQSKWPQIMAVYGIKDAA